MKDDEKKIWDKYGFIEASDVRKKIALQLSEEPCTPTKIAESEGFSLSHVSQKLKELSKEEIVECVNPKRRKGRLYALTEVGEKATNKLK